MPFVLDASVVITWAMGEEDHPAADAAFSQIQTDSAVVPGIWWYEIRNILLLNERRNRISREDSAQFLSDLDNFEIVVRFPGDGRLIADLAREHKLSVYDAAYLALAVEEKLPMATLDAQLQKAAQCISVPLLT